MNPLLEISFRVPFDQIQASDVEPAIDQLLADAAARLDQTVASADPLHALDSMTERLEYAMGVVRHLESVATTPELRAAFNAVQPEVSAFYSSIPLHEGLVEGDQALCRDARRPRRWPAPPPLPEQDHRFLPAPRRRTRSGRQSAA